MDLQKHSADLLATKRAMDEAQAALEARYRDYHRGDWLAIHDIGFWQEHLALLQTKMRELHCEADDHRKGIQRAPDQNQAAE